MESIIQSIYFSFFVLLVSFAILFKSADIFVESAVGISRIFHIPKMIVGIVIVGFATTAPEIAVSVQSAYLGHSEIALGNAIGSVIVDDGVALALAALLAPTVIFVDKKIFKTTALFLIAVDIIAFILAYDGSINRIEGALLVTLLIGYFFMIFRNEKKRRKSIIENGGSLKEEAEQNELPESKSKEPEKPTKYFIIFIAGLVGVILTSRAVIWSSVNIAHHFDVPEIIIGLTIIAIGTSLPEISTAVIASLKGHGEISVGNIIGADILNMLWIIGMSAIVRPIVVEQSTILFSFIWMFVIVGSVLLFLRMGYKLTKWKGIILILLYLGYLYMNLQKFYFH